MEPQLGLVEQSFDLRYSVYAREALNELPDCFTITDPCISGHPIVYASNAFLKMVGYSEEEVIGKNGRMFQGAETDRRSVMEIREAIREERAVEVKLLNYRKDGLPFWMLFRMCPVYSVEDGRVINFVGVQVPIMRKLRPSELCENGAWLTDSIYGCCRREVCSDRITNNGELDIKEVCEASEIEKTKSITAINNILSVLTHHSKLTGRWVCGQRHCLSRNEHLAAALHISLGRIKQSFLFQCVLSYVCRCDALLPDMPIMYASEAFLKLTGYARQEVIGKNCRFLSGVDTDPDIRFQIKESIQSQRACTVRILNYRKEGTSFWNFLHISPVRIASGKVGFYVGVQIEDDSKSREMGEVSPQMSQLSVVATVKVAVRGLSMRGASVS